jgi:putative SOS response-associated peptidase YedK
MCGRYVLGKTMAEVAARFGVVQPTLAFAPSYNMAPGQTLPVLIEEQGERHIVPMQWGLVPPWAANVTAHPSKPLINARAEGIATKPSFRRAVRSQRLLVPSSGYFEWQATASGKQPYFLHRADDALMGYAGLYEVGRDAAGEIWRTFTIITCAANERAAPIHQRMPVILQGLDEEALWLDAAITDVNAVTSLLRPAPSATLEVYPVSKRVNRVTNTGPELIQPVA